MTVLDRRVPLETMDFGKHPLLVMSFTSGAVRGLREGWRCISVARCFPELAREVGSTTIYPGVSFLPGLNELSDEIVGFSATHANRAAVEHPPGRPGRPSQSQGA